MTEPKGNKPTEPDPVTDRLAHETIGAAIEVHRIMGPGFLESVYEEAPCVEMQRRGIPFVRQHPVAMEYKGHAVGEARVDLMVGSSLIVELKAADALAPVHTAQVISYLKATGCRLGLLINFNEVLVKDGIRRIVLSP